VNIIRKNIFCRKALLKDMKLYYSWANEVEARKNSLNTQKISWENHKKWFKKKIKNKKSYLLVFEKKNFSIGQVRFDKAYNFVKVSFSISKKFRGLGIGKKMLNMAIKKYKTNKTISLIGEVKSKNLPSIRIFRALGFKEKINNKIYRFKKTLLLNND
jgi:L-amino acid N-acyltransferase YncA